MSSPKSHSHSHSRNKNDATAQFVEKHVSVAENTAANVGTDHSHILIPLPCIEYAQFMTETTSDEKALIIWANLTVKDVVEQESSRWQPAAVAFTIEKAITRKTRGAPHLRFKNQSEMFDACGFFPTDFFCYWGESHLDKKFGKSDNVNLMFKARRDAVPECIKLRRGIPLPALGVVLTQRNDLIKKLCYWSPNREDCLSWGPSKNDEDSSLMNQGNIMFYAKEGYKAEQAMQKGNKPVSPLTSDDDFRIRVLRKLHDPGYFAVIGYNRADLRQGTGFATTVIGGYDPSHDLVLILETDKGRFPMHWAPAKQLRKAICGRTDRGAAICIDEKLTGTGLIEMWTHGISKADRRASQ